MDERTVTDELTRFRVVHQATGVVAAQLGMTVEVAFERLEARATRDGRPLDELARDVLARHIRFDGSL